MQTPLSGRGRVCSLVIHGILAFDASIAASPAAAALLRLLLLPPLGLEDGGNDVGRHVGLYWLAVESPLLRSSRRGVRAVEATTTPMARVGVSMRQAYERRPPAETPAQLGGAKRTQRIYYKPVGAPLPQLGGCAAGSGAAGFPGGGRKAAACTGPPPPFACPPAPPRPCQQA